MGVTQLNDTSAVMTRIQVKRVIPRFHSPSASKRKEREGKVKGKEKGRTMQEEQGTTNERTTIDV